MKKKKLRNRWRRGGMMKRLSGRCSTAIGESGQGKVSSIIAFLDVNAGAGQNMN